MNGKRAPQRIQRNDTKEIIYTHRNPLQPPLLQHHHGQDPWGTTSIFSIGFQNEIIHSEFYQQIWIYAARPRTTYHQ